MRRRELIKLGLASGATFGLGCGDDERSSADGGATGDGGTTLCEVTPQQTAGPFYFDPDLERQEIAEGRPGVPFELALTIIAASDCQPLVGAVVDLWHCDAVGLYSGYPGQGDDGDVDTSGQSFCRGTQRADAAGEVVFTTVFPGWYRGRTIHFHFKIREFSGPALEATGQIYVPDPITAAVSDMSPYDQRGAPDTSNVTDSFAGDPAAEGTLASVSASGAGYRGAMTIGVRSSS